MSETMDNLNARTRASVHTGNGHATGGERHRADDRESATRGASRTERNHRLEEIKTGRRRARREKWLKGIKSPGSSLVRPEAVV
ncbi:MAG TPA: hypothetical protein VEZ40_14250 [Pyrinomonadaceae bacterium]|nr:hypothetical protein [Pyrinomonadaceae bacterium]